MNNLPQDIYLQLPSWLEYVDQVAFAMVNRTISRNLIKHVRVIQLGEFEKKSFEGKFRRYLTSEKLQSLIADPSNQFNVLFPDVLDLKEAGFEDISLSCKYLAITADQLTTSFMTSVKKVRGMMLGYYCGKETYQLTDSKLQSIAHWMNNSNLGLKQLTIKNYEITHLPVISKLESLTISNCNVDSLSGLNLPAYSNLRCLKLYSVYIEDVSSLDGIHELHLSYCNSIDDISCLNHNYKIVIEECYGITDYSNCFRNSRIINISYTRYTFPSMKSCDLSKALKAREIFFYGYRFSKPLLLPQSSSLRFVKVEFLPVRFNLHSKHRIQEIVLQNCILNPNSYLTNYGRIYSIKLINVEISTLIGLGRGNRVVEVDNCPSITDFSMLKHCDKLTIRNCEGFQDVEHVRGAKEFIFTPLDSNKLPKNMEGVTCLIFEYAPDNLLSMKFPRSLKKLVIKSEIREAIQQLPLFLECLPHHVEKVEVSDYKILLQLLEKGEISFPNFVIEFHGEVHFFRKVH